MNSNDGNDLQKCKYCENLLIEVYEEGLHCIECKQAVHLKCLKRGTVPGGLHGDIFFYFTCEDCSTTGSEHFVRSRMPWLQAIVLVLHHMQIKSPGLTKKGYFHWKIHITAFIDKNWDVLFRKDFKRKKKWTGTVSGTLSHYSPYFFQSGTCYFNEQGWWTLTYPKLTPSVIVQLNTEFTLKKQKTKEQKLYISDADLLKGILTERFADSDLLSTVTVLESSDFNHPPVKVKSEIHEMDTNNSYNLAIIKPKVEKNKKKKSLLPTLESFDEGLSKRSMKETDLLKKFKKDSFTVQLLSNSEQIFDREIVKTEKLDAMKTVMQKPFLNPFCYYNTSINNISRLKSLSLKDKLMGGIRLELILSPYTTLYLKPIIRRDIHARPHWLKMMFQIQLRMTGKMDTRGPIDYTYVQPEHIPAINTLCNQFFWPGIDMTESLQYPDFSCVALYRKLIVAFGFVVPDVKLNEHYVSFLFTRPGWRNVGIGRFMLYHLIQVSGGKDLTLHVSINNSALFLYQKMGFKVECVVQDFYDKYLPKDSKDSKNAFFCRLER